MFTIMFSCMFELFVSKNASENNSCSFHSPCSFDRALFEVDNLVNLKKIFIIDNYTEDVDELKDFQIFMNYILAKNIKIVGNHSVLNGKNFPSYSQSYLYTKGGSPEISGFSFINWNFPIICFQDTQNGKIEDCLFNFNNIETGFGLIIAGTGQMTINSCHFMGNIGQNKSLISCFTGWMIFKKCVFQNNSIFDDHPSPLFQSLNAGFEFDDTVLQQNFVPFNLISLEYRSYLYLYKTTIRDHNCDLINFDNFCNITILFSVIQNINGAITKVNSKNFSSLRLMVFYGTFFNNTSPKLPLFSMGKSKVTFILSNFSNNYGNGIFDLSNQSGSFLIVFSSFTENKFGPFLIGGENIKAYLILTKLLSNQMSSLFYETNSSIQIYGSTFRYNHDINLYFNQAQLIVAASSFSNNTFFLENEFSIVSLIFCNIFISNTPLKKSMKHAIKILNYNNYDSNYFISNFLYNLNGTEIILILIFGILICVKLSSVKTKTKNENQNSNFFKKTKY